MKLNERTLIDVAQSPENITDQCGWLFKLNDEKKTFQKQWCVLKENLFFHYEHKNDKEPLGVIILEGYRVEIVENASEQFTFKIDFGVSQFGLQLKSYTFAAENHKDMESWVKSLSCASYDYLKMVVSELQHRLDELNVLKSRESVISRSSTSGHNNDFSKLTRHNPFDSIEQEPMRNLTFHELHQEYGITIRQYFKDAQSDNQIYIQQG